MRVYQQQLSRSMRLPSPVSTSKSPPQAFRYCYASLHALPYTQFRTTPASLPPHFHRHKRPGTLPNKIEAATASHFLIQRRVGTASARTASSLNLRNILATHHSHARVCVPRSAVSLVFSSPQKHSRLPQVCVSPNIPQLSSREHHHPRPEGTYRWCFRSQDARMSYRNIGGEDEPDAVLLF